MIPICVHHFCLRLIKYACCFASIEELLRDTDSELEEGEDPKTRKKKLSKKSAKAKKGSAWLKEEGDEEIVDFMDSSVTKKVLGKRRIINI